MSSITSLARIGANSFHTVKCDESRMPDGFFYVKNDDAPEWVVELVRDAHDDMFPDDYVYSYIVESLEALAEEDDVQTALDRLNNGVDTVTSRLLHWVSSHSFRMADANTYGVDRADFNSIDETLTGGQYYERGRIFHSVWSALQNLGA